MQLLFKEAIKSCFHPHENRLRKLNTWIENSNTAQATQDIDAKLNQCDKAEELITFYTFAPLVLSPNRAKLTNKILQLAKVNACVARAVNVILEKQCKPPEAYLERLIGDTKNHPVTYIRKQAEKHKQNQPLESKTHVDAFVETEKLLILFEIKFTSDISYEVTFNPTRNQLARLIDVGLEASNKNKKVLVILSTPRKLFKTKSRLYYYKIKDYADPKLIQEDLPWRDHAEIENALLAVKWVALEDLIDTLYKDFDHVDKEKALGFFNERKLKLEANK